MVPKPVTFTSLIDGRAVAVLDGFLRDLAQQVGQVRMGRYTGTGVSGQALTLGFRAQFLYIGRVATGDGLFGVIALRETPDVTYLPGKGFVAGAVVGWTNDGVTLGTDVSVNEGATGYAYFAIG